jgi:hypothetical protein
MINLALDFFEQCKIYLIYKNIISLTLLSEVLARVPPKFEQHSSVPPRPIDCSPSSFSFLPQSLPFIEELNKNNLLLRNK